jgi:DNA-binding beta-propeller fold protein YncE
VSAAAGCVALAMGLFPTGAAAARPHEFTTSFGEPCTLAPCGPGELKEPSGVAVNEATHQVYVIDQGNDRVEIFDGQTGAIEGEIKEFEVEPGVTQTFEFGGAAQNGGIAVDNSCHLQGLVGSACASADPSNGDIYVLEHGRKLIDKFGPNGEFLGRITEGLQAATYPPEGVTVDPSGGVWVFREEEIVGYTDGEPNAPAPPGVAINAPGFAAPGFAVDAAGSFYIRDRITGRPRISKFSSSGARLSEKLDDEESSAVAVDQALDTAVVDNLTSLGVFESSGSEIERLGTEGGAAHLTEGAGVAVDAGASTIYVADAGAGEVVVFGPKSATTPKVEGSSIASVNAQEATIEAQINPRSEPGEAATEYHVAYGRCATPTSCALSGYEGSVPVPDGQIPADFEPHTVGVTLTGLEPGATYHLQVIARNSHGEGEPGEELVFTTQGGGQLVLPDGRAWEMVSPPDKQGARIEPISESGVVEAAADGSALTYLTSTPTEADPAGYTNLFQVLSRRGASWSTRDIGIPHGTTTGSGAASAGPEYKFFNPQLTLAAVQPFGAFNPGLSAEASEQTAYLRSLDPACGPSCYRPLVSSTNAPGVEFGEEGACEPHQTGTTTQETCGPRFLGAAPDLRHVVLRSAAALTAGGPTDGLYEWSEGLISPVSILPGGAPASGSVGLGDLGSNIARGAISTDGSRIVWSTATGLYQRDMGRSETLQLDQAEEVGGTPCAGCASGGGQFQIASADGSRVFFTDTNPLTANSGSEPLAPQKADLYECRVVEAAGKLACDLTDLTPLQGTEGAAVLGIVLGAGASGSDIYFVARGSLSGPNGEGRAPSAGRPNLYLDREGVNTFIATLAEEDLHDWEETRFLPRQPTRVSPNGRYLEFMSQASPTGYDNRDRATGRPTAEVYLYDAATGRLECASCDPSGARPDGVEYLKLEPGNGGLVGGPKAIWGNNLGEELVAANVPGWTGMTATAGRYQPRYLDDQGRLFFDTVNALVPQDSNGTQDVYEYEPPQGPGQPASNNCSTASETFSARSGGCVSLISAGTSGQESAFMDASESGEDVFFLTSSRLSGQDTDNQLDIYDAHVCSATSPCLPEAAEPPPPCTGEACQGTAAPPAEASPSTSEFAGPGNPKPARKKGCPKGKVRRGGKCVKKQAKKLKARSHKKHSGKKGKRANNDRRAGR